jgi:DNA-directed RNA polymerase alpha subunit
MGYKEIFDQYDPSQFSIYSSVNDIEWSVRVQNALYHHGCEILLDVCCLPLNKLRNTRNCGRKSVKEIQYLLHHVFGEEFVKIAQIMSS